jgi:hypothetical protein
MSIVQECRKAWEKLINGDASAGEISVVRGDESHRVLGFANSAGDDGYRSTEENLDKWFFLKK